MHKIAPYFALIAFFAIVAAFIVIPFFAHNESEDEEAILTEVEHERGVRAVLDLPTQRRGQRLTPEALTFSPDGKLLAGRSSDGLHLWNPADGSRVGPQGRKFLRVGGGLIEALTFSPDGSRLAAIADRLHGDAADLMVWDTRTGERLHTTEIDMVDPQALAYSPDGRAIAWLSQSSLGTWQPEDGDTRQVDNDGSFAMAWSESDSGAPILVTLSDRVIEHRAPRTLEISQRLDFESDLHFVSFVGGGSHILHANHDRVELRASRTGVVTASGNNFTPDINYACAPKGMPWVALGNTNEGASGTREGRIQLWHPEASTPYVSVPAHEHRVLSMACGPQGQLATSNDLVGKVWDVPLLESMWPTGGGSAN